MNLVLAIFLIMAAFAGGVILGMYLLRRQVEKEFKVQNSNVFLGK